MAMARRACRLIGVLALSGALLTVQGCREEEQGRPLLYDKGTYLGQPDPPLDDTQVEALRQRARHQGS